MSDLKRRRRALFGVDGGWEEICDWWDGEAEIPRDRLIAMLCQAQREGRA